MSAEDQDLNKSTYDSALPCRVLTFGMFLFFIDFFHLGYLTLYLVTLQKMVQGKQVRFDATWQFKLCKQPTIDKISQSMVTDHFKAQM